jgi:hypothetical protein
LELSSRDRKILLSGGLLKFTLEKANDKSSKRIRDRQGKTRR